jgi:hypothetical protein
MPNVSVEAVTGTSAMATAPADIELPEAQAPVSPPVSPTTQRRRGTFRISVRGLLLFVLLAGCGMGLLTHIVRTGQAQRKAVAAVYQAGGWVLYDIEWDERQATSQWRLGWPRWFIDRVGADYCAHVVFINLHDRGTDAVLAQVGQFTHLKQLHRPGRRVTDLGLAHLGRLSELQYLSLDRTQATDAGLAHLKGLANLRWLKLAQTKVTDAGLSELRKSLPQLQAIR